MSRFDHAASASFCGLSTASAAACTLVVEAIDDNASYVHAASAAELDEAVHALESCRLHGCDAHQHEDQALALLAERKCAHCGVWVAGDELVDVTDLAPLSGPICAHCERDLVAELRDNDTSPPDHEADAATRGGLRPEALALLGLDKGEL
jgi:hypothetical protein